MADASVPELTALTGAGSASTDLAHVVDVSDTTADASGTDKRMTLAELALGLITHGSIATDAEVTAAVSALSTVYQPLDSDLTAIAALTTTAFGRAFLVLADVSAAQTALVLVPGTDVEAHDADLTTIAGLTPTNDDVLQRKAGAWTNRTIAQLLTDLGLGALYQPLDSDLTAIAALTTTATGRSLLAAADAAALRVIIDSPSNAEAILDTIIAAKGDLLAGTANDTVAVLTAGANDTILMADSAQTAGLKWVASQTPSTQAVGDAAAEGTADTYARGDHKHAMPAFATNTVTLATAATAGSAATLVRSDAAIAAFDATAPTTQALGDAAAAGSAAFAARRDHVHGALTSAAILAGAQTFNAQTGTTYTLVAGDVGKHVTLSNAAAVTLTVPQDSDATIAIGCFVDITALGAGQVTTVAGTGATLRVSGLTAKSRAQYARMYLQKISANTWQLAGDLAAS